jgi:hypothetical protein
VAALFQSSEGTFPGATKTFTIKRRGPVYSQNSPNPTMGYNTIATGIPVVLTVMVEKIEDDSAGPQYTGNYRGATFPDMPVFIHDVLFDETENEVDGTPVKYEVQGKSIGAFSMQLHLTRTNPGV